MKGLLLVFAAYLIGSIPFSFLLSKTKGKDPRLEGTKNVGATNALVVAGPLIGALVLLGDVGKGFLAVALARYFQLPDWGIMFCGLAVVAGHDFSLFLQFKGGKGVAAFFGSILALDPIFAFLLFLLWVLAMIIFQYFIPATVLLFCFVPLLMWMASWKSAYLFFGILNALLAIYTHRLDLQRFFAGKELSIQQALAKFRNK